MNVVTPRITCVTSIAGVHVSLLYHSRMFKGLEHKGSSLIPWSIHRSFQSTSSFKLNRACNLSLAGVSYDTTKQKELSYKY